MILYNPKIRDYPRLVKVRSAWGKIPEILQDIIMRFNIKTDVALEFGVEQGRSTSAIANYFKRVIGVDTFCYNITSMEDSKPSNFYDVLKILRRFYNIQLIETRFEEFIKHDIYEKYDLIHVDLIHYYKPTYLCGEWSVQHSDCVLFHDTDMPEIMKVCEDLSGKYNFEFYNYPHYGGLGILIKK
ncbi:MAG: class I SAM-dependent methyltransferase [Bacteroidales bacterium]